MVGWLPWTLPRASHFLPPFCGYLLDPTSVSRSRIVQRSSRCDFLRPGREKGGRMCQIRKLCGMGAALLLLPLLSPPCRAQGNRAPFDPVVTETPWGQKVVPSLQRYIEIQIYEQLRRGQSWSDGGPIRAKLIEDYRQGRLTLRRYPWRVVEGVYCLGHDDNEQQI